MKNLFIDSNIYLNFYDFYDEDLDELGKLVEQIQEGHLRLYTTSQVIGEVKKNRELRLKDAYTKFSKASTSIPMPVFCKHYDEYERVKRAQDLLEKAKSQLAKSFSEDIDNLSLKADTVFNNLNKVATVIDSDAYYDLAKKRHELGRPPGKDPRTFGDEITWETLLDCVETDGEFIVISGDGDFSNDFTGNTIRPYLKEEWQRVKGTDIYLYKSLGTFFREHDIAIELKADTEKNEYIEILNDCPNFLCTHSTVRSLNKFTVFSDEQIKRLGSVLLGNSQVRWIAQDEDVQEFYKTILQGKQALFEESEWARIRELLDNQNDLDESLDKLSEDIEPVEKKENDDIPF
jgi:predicted nucleic acid-binding protein